VSQFQKVAAIALLLCGVAMVAAAADRIFTTPNPAAELKRLFPAAAAFSALTGEPLHFTAYGTDPKTNPSAPPQGVAFWTTDLVPQEHGYHGPIHILVGMDMTGVLTGVVVTYNSEPYGYFSVEPPKFAMQFKRKKISDPFRVGGDVDAVSRASISIASATRAIRDSARMVAKQLLPEAGK
jgi:transcriptional regulator of nitric oxide reductase